MSGADVALLGGSCLALIASGAVWAWAFSITRYRNTAAQKDSPDV